MANAPQSLPVSVPIPGPGILMFGVGVFAAWLFATGRLDAVRQAIASGSASGSSTTTSAPVQPATGALVASPSTVTATPAVTAAAGSFLAAYNSLQAGGLPAVQIRPDASGGLTADVGAAAGANTAGP